MRIGAIPLAALCLLASPAATGAEVHGIVPQGFWVLNQARSRSLEPGRQTLWIVKDDGTHLLWTSVLIDDRRRARIMSYEGVYGGPPAPVAGAPMTTRIVATGPTTLHNEGTVAGVGAYAEDCVVSAYRRRFRCAGRLQAPGGVRAYVDDFDWYGESPPSARP